MSKKENLRISPTRELKNRIKEIKPQLKEIGIDNVIEIIASNYPKYNVAIAGRLITQVINDRIAHLELTEILQKVANEEITLKTK